MSGDPACAHLSVAYQTETLPRGGIRGWWACVGCGRRFTPIVNSLVDGAGSRPYENESLFSGSREGKSRIPPPSPNCATCDKPITGSWCLTNKGATLHLECAYPPHESGIAPSLTFVEECAPFSQTDYEKLRSSIGPIFDSSEAKPTTNAYRRYPSQQAWCPECGHNPNLRAHSYGCAIWAKEARLMQNITQRLDRTQAVIRYPDRFPQQPEEPSPAPSWWSRFMEWLG